MPYTPPFWGAVDAGFRNACRGSGRVYNELFDLMLVPGYAGSLGAFVWRDAFSVQASPGRGAVFSLFY